MPTTAAYTYSMNGLVPLFHPEDAIELAVKLANGTYAKGTVLAEVAATPGTFTAYDGTPLAAPAAAPVPTEGAAGALGAGDYYVAYSYVVGTKETAPSAAVAATLGASKKLHVAAVTKPTGVDSINWYMSDAANSLQLRYISNNAGIAQDINALPAVDAAEPLAVGTARAVDGSGVARGILRYACTVAASIITLVDEFVNPTSVPMFMGGYFATADLTGLDATAIEDMGGQLVQGTVSAGIFKF